MHNYRASVPCRIDDTRIPELCIRREPSPVFARRQTRSGEGGRVGGESCGGCSDRVKSTVPLRRLFKTTGVTRAILGTLPTPWNYVCAHTRPPPRDQPPTTVRVYGRAKAVPSCADGIIPLNVRVEIFPPLEFSYFSPPPCFASFSCSALSRVPSRRRSSPVLFLRLINGAPRR